MKIAIVGAGFAGLASAYTLLEHYPSVTIIADQEPGGGASGVAAGLLHPYAGLKSRLNPRGIEAYTESKKLLDKASKQLGKPVYRATGLLRPALNQEQFNYFQAAANTYPDIRWLDDEQCQELAPGMAQVSGIFIESGLTIDPQLYLAGLWQLCQARGATFSLQHITTLAQLSEYDRIIVAAGADTLCIAELTDLSLTPIKGQILEYPWPQTIPMPATAVNGQVYLLPDLQNQRCIVGSTFERHFIDPTPNLAVAMEHLHPKLCEMYPAFKDIHPTACMAGVRASAPMHLPFIRKVGERCIVYSGLGSKGLLYHALMAKELMVNEK